MAKAEAAAKTQVDKMEKALQEAKNATSKIKVDMEAQNAMLTAAYANAMAAGSKGQDDTAKMNKALKAGEHLKSPTKSLKIDFGAGLTAQVSTELLNLAVRALADWAPESWWGKNSDYMQGAPHALLGLGIYAIEMASRKQDVFPTERRVFINEAAKLFAHLGMNNVARAFRVRFWKKQQDAIDTAASRAEAARLKEMNQQLLDRLAKFEKKQ